MANNKKAKGKAKVPTWVRLTQKKVTSKDLLSQNGDLPPVPEWKPWLSQYRNLQLLRFPSKAQLHAAIELLWTEPYLDLPHDTPDGKTLILPAEALPYFARAGIEFIAEKALSITDLTEEEIAQVRRS